MDPLVGRGTEVARLRHALAGARAGSGRLVLVSGPAGIGKTRLVEELAATEEIETVWGAAIDDAGAPALWPWTRALQGLPGPHAAITSSLSGAGLHEYGSADEAAASTFAADTAVVDALGEHARTAGGLLIVLDDLQWADHATLRLLGRLAAGIRRLAILVVATIRDGAVPAPLPRNVTEVVSLGPLGLDEAATLLTNAVPQADPGAVRHAAEQSGGSPLYLRTLGWVAADQLRGRKAWDDAVGEAPELRNLVAAATRNAGPGAAQVVEALSVLGPEAEPELIAQLIGADSVSAILERLAPAVPAGLVEIPSARTGRVRFPHALVRDAVYASLPPTRRAALHRRAAESLEPLAVARDDRAGAVARHWDRAGEPGRAVGWAVRAADAARAAAAYDEAVSYLELAMHAMDRDAAMAHSGADRAELALDLARAQYLSGRIRESIHTCGRAADEGERSGRPEIVARSAIVVQGVGDPAVNVRIAGLCRRALAMLDGEAAPELCARVQAQLACALLETGELDEAARSSRAALDAAHTSGDPHAELDAIRARVAVAWRPSEDIEVFDLGGRAIELAQATDRPLATLWAHVWRSDCAVHRGDLATAQQEIAAMQALADRTGLALVRWHVLRRHASVAALTGDFHRCRRLAAKAALVLEDRYPSVRNTHIAQAVCLALLRGDPADLAPGWDGHLDDVDRYPAVGRAVMAACLLMAGRRDEAWALYRPLLLTISGARYGRLDAAALVFLPDLAMGFDDAAGCHVVRDVITRMFGESAAAGAGTSFYSGSVARILGELDLECGDFAAAVTRFEEGLRVDSAMGARPYVARGRMGLARALAATGDLPRAAKLAREAAGEARRLDMPGLLRAAGALIADVGLKARAADPLSPREREVVALVAQALPNREIARVLVLSERTVESHVRRILAKTGLTSRTELIRWRLENGG